MILTFSLAQERLGCATTALVLVSDAFGGTGKWDRSLATPSKLTWFTAYSTDLDNVLQLSHDACQRRLRQPKNDICSPRTITSRGDPRRFGYRWPHPIRTSSSRAPSSYDSRIARAIFLSSTGGLCTSMLRSSMPVSFEKNPCHRKGHRGPSKLEHDGMRAQPTDTFAVGRPRLHVQIPNPTCHPDKRLPRLEDKA